MKNLRGFVLINFNMQHLRGRLDGTFKLLNDWLWEQNETRLKIRSYNETTVRTAAKSMVGLVVNYLVSFDKYKQEDKVIYHFSLTYK